MKPELKDKISNSEGIENNPMAFEKNTFSHILCLYKNLYRFRDKEKVLLNIYHWLQPNGYFILQIIDPFLFDSIVPAAKQNSVYNEEEEEDGRQEDKRVNKNRIRNTEIDFLHFDYKASWKQNTGGGLQEQQEKQEEFQDQFTEIFRDNRSGKIRQNDFTYYMQDIQSLLKLINKCGFIVKGKAEWDGKKEYLYVFERPNFY